MTFMSLFYLVVVWPFQLSITHRAVCISYNSHHYEFHIAMSSKPNISKVNWKKRIRYNQFLCSATPFTAAAAHSQTAKQTESQSISSLDLINQHTMNESDIASEVFGFFCSFCIFFIDCFNATTFYKKKWFLFCLPPIHITDTDSTLIEMNAIKMQHEIM